MSHMRIRTASLVCLVALALGLAGIALHAYNTFGKWETSSVPVYVNPQNADVTSAAAEAAVQAGMNVWNTQGKSAFAFTYAGRVNDTTTGYDNRNVVIFRNASNGSAIASTYSWSVGTQVVDADVIFWDQGFRFFTGTSGCSSGVYIEDVATHELGHALGLLHSGDASATMYSGYPYCSQELRTLAADDVAGVQSLYGASSSKTTTNSAPSVKITSPGNGTSYGGGATISFAGSASDAEDGNLSSSLIWTSSLDGVIGSGSSFGRTLSTGTHVVTAAVTDHGGSSGAASVTVSVVVSSSPGGTPVLSASGFRTKRQLKVSLAWNGFSDSMLDVYRNSALVFSTENDGSQTDTIKANSGTFVYQVCARGTTMCSNQATVGF